LNAVASGSTANTKRCCWPSHAADRSAGWTSRSCSDCDILPSVQLVSQPALSRCQGNAAQRWLQARERSCCPPVRARRLHAAAGLAPLACRITADLQPAVHSSLQTLQEIARDPRHLGAEIGFFSVLHTWINACSIIPIVHCVSGAAVSLRTTPAGSHRAGPLPSGQSARPCLPRQVCRRLKRLSCRRTPVPRTSLTLAEPRAFASWLRVLFRHDWVVYSKRPFGGPEHVLRYLGPTPPRCHSNSRLVALSRAT